MKKISDKYYIQINLIFILTISLFILLTAFYILLPSLMNYPSGTVGTDFQHELENADYTSQVVLIGLAVFIVYCITIFYKTRFLVDINSKLKNISSMSSESITSLKNKLFSTPYTIYLLNIFLPILVITLIHGLTTNSMTLKMYKIILILFSFITVSSTACLVITRRLFTQILAKLPDTENNSYKKLKLVWRIAFHILPLFIVGIVFTAFLGYSRIVLEKGETISKVYKDRLYYNIQLSDISTYDDLLAVAKKIELNSTLDYTFICTPEEKFVNTDGQEINVSDFFKKYMKDFSLKTDFRVYEYYGEDSQGVIQPVTIDGKTYIIGIYYYVLSPTTISFFIFVFVILLSLNLFILNLFSNTLSSDLKRIAKGMEDIVEGKDISLAKNLPLISNDEIGELTLAFNKIQEMTKKNIEQIHSSQDMLVEKERLASLGQMIGRNCPQFKNSYNVYFWSY